jgi:hypothetical protein
MLEMRQSESDCDVAGSNPRMVGAEEGTMTRAAIGSIAGSSAPRADNRPNMRNIRRTKMISKKEIEAYAVQMAAPGFEGSRASVEKLIGHLDEDDFYAVCSRCSQISRERGNEEDAGPVTLTEQEIEALGSQLADDWSRGEWHTEATATAGLHGANLDAVLTRAQDISFDRNAPEQIDSTESLLRLAHATGCPESEAIIPWLQERDQIEQVEGGWRFKAAKPRAVT